MQITNKAELPTAPAHQQSIANNANFTYRYQPSRDEWILACSLLSEHLINALLSHLKQDFEHQLLQLIWDGHLASFCFLGYLTGSKTLENSSRSVFHFITVIITDKLSQTHFSTKISRLEIFCSSKCDCVLQISKGNC